MSFLLWRPGRLQAGVCKIGGVHVDKDFQLASGVSRAAGWASTAYCEMDADFPKDIELADCHSALGVAIVSRTLREALESADVNNVEFLPVKIMNHKGRVASADYFVLNPLDVCDCIDKDASTVEWNEIDPESIGGCASLVLDEAAVPAGYKLFRPKFWLELLLVRKELADVLKAAGLTGLSFKDPADYEGLG